MPKLEHLKTVKWPMPPIVQQTLEAISPDVRRRERTSRDDGRVVRRRHRATRRGRRICFCRIYHVGVWQPWASWTLHVHTIIARRAGRIQGSFSYVPAPNELVYAFTFTFHLYYAVLRDYRPSDSVDAIMHKA